MGLALALLGLALAVLAALLLAGRTLRRDAQELGKAEIDRVTFHAGNKHHEKERAIAAQQLSVSDAARRLRERADNRKD